MGRRHSLFGLDVTTFQFLLFDYCVRVVSVLFQADLPPSLDLMAPPKVLAAVMNAFNDDLLVIDPRRLLGRRRNTIMGWTPLFTMTVRNAISLFHHGKP